MPSKSSSSDTKKVSVFATIRTFFADERVHFLWGVFLLLFAFFLGLSFLSFFFTGAEDQSFLYSDNRIHYTPSFDAQNWTGRKGAFLAEFFINNGFGLPAFFLVFLLVILSFRAFKRPLYPLWRAFALTLFALVWGGTLLAFLLHWIFRTTFLYVGGKAGLLFSDTLVEHLGRPGSFLLLFFLGITFLLCFSRRSLPFFYRLFTQPQSFFARRRPEVTIDTPLSPETPEVETPQSSSLLPVSFPQTATDSPSSDPTSSAELTTEPEILTPQNPDSSTQIVIDTPQEQEQQDQPEIPVTPISTPQISLPDGSIKPADGGEIIDDDNPLSSMEKYDPRLDLSTYQFPPLSLLKTYPNENSPQIDLSEQEENKQKIVSTLHDFGIEIERIDATVGPTITLYELVPKTGIKISKIRSLERDIMMSLAAIGIRIIAPIPGKGTVGIEIPNKKSQIVSMHSVIASRKFQEESKFALPVAIGRTITNEVFMFDLAKSPHLLVAGATGQGKSVGLNAIITSLLYKKHPSELKFVLVDPKMVEFNIYKAIERHYLAALPDTEDVIITDCSKVIQTLNSLVVEMEDRYKLLMKASCRNIIEYNDKFINRQLSPKNGHRYLPYIVIVIDEFGDFIMQVGKEVETPIARITQKARAVGMHMILATQRPSVNIITGVIKANVPGRVAFKVASQIDSRTILDATGAEGLVGKGDMLYLHNSDLIRVQCAFVDTPEVESLTQYINQQQGFPSPYQLPEVAESDAETDFSGGNAGPIKIDTRFVEAAHLVVQQQKASTSNLQQIMELGFNRAARIMNQLEQFGIVGKGEGAKPRKVLIMDEMQLDEILSQNHIK